MIQNIKLSLGLILLAIMPQVLFSQNASIEFFSEENTSVVIYRPIDGGYNSFYPTDTIKLDKNKKKTYNVRVEDWAIVRCKFPKRMNMDIFIEKDDTIRVISTEQNTFFEGDNAIPNDYLYFYSFLKDLKIRTLIDSVFETKDLKKIEEVLVNPMALIKTLGIVEKIDSMYVNQHISSTCYNFLNRELDYRLKNRILSNLNKCLYHSVIDDSTYYYCTDKILDNVTIDYNDIRSSLGGMFIGKYCNRLYERLESNSKEYLISKYNAETFGPYISYLVGPDNIQLNRLFDAFIVEYQSGDKTFDHFKMFEYLSKKYPQSESVKILRTFVEKEARDTIPIDTVIIDSKSVDSFSDICRLKSFEGKYLFIDVWASWCMPCRYEFSHSQQLETLLEQYPNLEKLYISIDEKEEPWKKAIETMRISGYHLRASENLLKYLGQEIYQSNQITVPRYILMDNKGKILNTDMSRPSLIDQLKIELDRIFSY